MSDKSLEEQFNSHFLNHIILNCIINTSFAKKVINVIDPKIFKIKEKKFIFNIIKDYVKEFDECPSDHFYDLFEERKNELPNKNQEKCIEIINNIRQINHSNPEYVLNRIHKAISYFEFEDAIVQCAKLHKAGKEAEAKSLILKAIKKPEEVKSSYYDFLKDTSYIEERSKGKTYKMKTLVKEVDDLIGGFNPTWLTVILGSTKAGKTKWLVELTIAGAIQGLNGLFVSGEMNKTQIDNAFDQAIGFLGDRPGEAIETMKFKKGEWVKVKMEVPTIYDLNIVEKNRRALSKRGGLIKISDKTGGKFNYYDVEILLDQIEEDEGITFDFVVVDYLGHMGPTEKGQDRKLRNATNAEGLKAIAKERNLIVITAQQGNRQAMQAKTFQSHMVAEDINTIWIADLIPAICQTEKEEKENQYRWFVAENRNGPKHGFVNLVKDLNRGAICLGKGKDIKLEDDKNEYNDVDY